MPPPEKPASTSSAFTDMLEQKRQLEEELKAIELRIYENETIYLTETAGFGNVLRGWETSARQSKS